MNTEITDKIERGWVLYDGACIFCKGLVGRWRAALKRRGFACIPLQTDWVRERLNLSEDELMLEMRVLEPSGKVIGGAAAVLLLARTFWWALPLVWLAKLPGAFRLMDAAYRWGAARRYCINGACATPPDGAGANRSPARTALTRFADSETEKAAHVSRRLSSAAVRKALLLLLPLCVLFVRGEVPAWAFMWLMAGALWLALKLFTFLDVRSPPSGRSIAYLTAWPGMDAGEFFGNAKVPQPMLRDWFFAVFNVSLGTALIYGGARAVHAASPLLAGWAAMIGIVLLLHFGLFKCLALLWRASGIPATPIMDAPLRSSNLSEFWGRRWNTGFCIPARRYLMEPIARRFGTTAGLLTVFVISGLVHELVISVPAKAGYGLPTLYFLIQGGALACERKVGTNRLLTLLCVAAPAFVLFHPPFVHNVILPFLKVMGAL